MLGAQGIQLRNTYCTLLMARLALGAERGGLKLADVAAEFLDGLELPKVEQVSDWAAERLSEQQLAYAALDAAVAHMLARPLWGELDGGARQAFKVGNATVPAVASMRLAGIPFDRQIARGDDRRLGAVLRRGARFVRRDHGRRHPARGRAALGVARGADAAGHARVVAADRDRALAHPQRRPRAAGGHPGDPAPARGDPLGQALARVRAHAAREGGRRRPAPHGPQAGLDEDRPLRVPRSQLAAAAPGRAPGRGRAARAGAGDRRLQSDRVPGRERALRRRRDARGVPRRRRHAHPERRGLRRRQPRDLARGRARSRAQQGQADRVRHALRQRSGRARGVGVVHVPDRDERGGGAGVEGPLLRPLPHAAHVAERGRATRPG